MTFFYDMNKKLKEVLDAPKSVNQQLNERAEHKPVDEGMFDSLKAGMAKAGKVAKAVGKKGLETLGHGSDADMMRDLQRKMGVPQTGQKPRTPIAKEEYGPLEEEGNVPMTPKQKKFAKLAPPADKITFADKIAGAKKEVDEMLGDVAAEAMRKAVKGKKVVADEGFGDMMQTAGAKLKGLKANITKNPADRQAAMDAHRNIMKKELSKVKPGDRRELGGPSQRYWDAENSYAQHKVGLDNNMEEGWDDMLKDVEKRRTGMKTGEKIQGHKGEIEKTATGIKHTRKYDAKTGETDTGDDAPAAGEKRGRGRPKKTDKAPERVTAKAYKHKGGRVAEQGEEELDELSPETIASYQKKAYPQAAAAGPKSDQRAAGVARSLGRTTSEGEEELDEKAVSKKQQKFMGMVHAAQKGEKPASKEVAKVAKTMKKKDAEDFASTKHKGLPEKKKREKTEETAGDTPKAATNGSGMQFGKGIYDSLNREIENIIAESMNVSMSDSTEGGKSLTISATEEDAVKLAAVLKLAGIGGAPEGEAEVVGIQSPISGDEGACPTCGSHDCGCGDIEEALDENQPDWPTDEVTSDDALQYAGGLNKPKTTVAGDGQTTVPVTAVQVREEELDEQEQVMAPESIEEAQEMCEVCEAVPCKCDESIEESLARFRSLAGIQEAKVEEDDVEEGNKFTGNLAKARAAGKTEADLDGDGDLEKVRESVSRLNNLWKAYKG